MSLRIGLISDTHGLLRPEAIDFLQGCDHIVHAGDITDAAVLDALAALAPLTAVRGNNDRGAWARRLKATQRLEIGGISIYVVHDLSEMKIDPAAAAIDVVVSGHSHSPGIQQRSGVLYLNPGSAGRRRFKLPVAIAELRVSADGQISARIVDLLAPRGIQAAQVR